MINMVDEEIKKKVREAILNIYGQIPDFYDEYMENLEQNIKKMQEEIAIILSYIVVISAESGIKISEIVDQVDRKDDLAESIRYTIYEDAIWDLFKDIKDEKKRSAVLELHINTMLHIANMRNAFDTIVSILKSVDLAREIEKELKDKMKEEEEDKYVLYR